MSGNKSQATQVVRRPLQCCFRCEAAEMQKLFSYLLLSVLWKELLSSWFFLKKKKKSLIKLSKATVGKFKFRVQFRYKHKDHIYLSVFWRASSWRPCSAVRARRRVCSGRASYLIELSSHIWLSANLGIDATHSKYIYNGSSWKDYEGCESTGLNGLGWRRRSGSLARAFRLLQPLSVRSYREGATWGVFCRLLWPLQSEDPDPCFLPVLRTTPTLWVCG